MHSDEDLAANLARAERLIAQAAAEGARLAVLPECFAFIDDDIQAQFTVAENDGDGPIQNFLAEQAARHGVWLVGGSLPIRTDGDKVRAACPLFNDKGERVARYDKIHLFDVFVEESGESYGESTVFQPGRQAVTADTPCGRLGFTICYDLRFPELFRALIDQGADYIVVPSAFTAPTGAAHWNTLLRSRAIENSCYVVAANQGNRRRGNRDSYGHSLIADPWGEVLCELGDEPGVAVATLDRDRLTRIRRDFPCLQHRKYAVHPSAEHAKAPAKEYA